MNTGKERDDAFLKLLHSPRNAGRYDRFERELMTAKAEHEQKLEDINAMLELLRKARNR